jgi:hypothetical protein
MLFKAAILQLLCSKLAASGCLISSFTKREAQSHIRVELHFFVQTFSIELVTDLLKIELIANLKATVIPGQIVNTSPCRLLISF